MNTAVINSKNITAVTKHANKSTSVTIKRITGDYYYITPRFVVQSPKERTL